MSPIEQNDEQFESRLREFQPRHPRALPDAPQVAAARRRLAAAAVVALFLAAAVWFAVTPRPTLLPETTAEESAPTESVSVRLTSLSLTRLATMSPEKLDGALIDASRLVLPDFRERDSSLGVLAKE
jgi:ferric-dicitrate binding protein FerR (iron transport regulator)